MILAIRTDNPTVELILLQASGEIIAREEWLAERRLALELLGRLEQLIGRHNLNWNDLEGLIVFRGPGSFTGLRIGLTVLNTIAYAQGVAIVGAMGSEWLSHGAARLARHENDGQVLPEYGAPVHITTPRK